MTFLNNQIKQIGVHDMKTCNSIWNAVLAVLVLVAADAAAQTPAAITTGHCACRFGTSAAGGQTPTPTDTSKWPCQGERQFTDGKTQVQCPRFVRSYPSLPYRAVLAAGDRFSPHPVYAYSRTGIDAARVHEWNKFQSQRTPWHGTHNYWQYNRPTALVVPPTAAFQTSYGWGVGQTRSLPINHQFGLPSPGGGGVGGDAFSPAPYMPSNTEQLGVYPVRAPWSHQ
jgi:hypothetical protein